MKKLICIILCVSISLTTLVSCKTKPKDVKLEVWSAPISQKIYQDKEYSAKGGAALNFSLAKGEYENAQLIFTPDNKVNSYKLILDDVKDDNGNIIKKERFTVYKQLYIPIEKKYNINEEYPIGMAPDALVPIEYIKGDELTVNAKDNQGLWITVKSANLDNTGIYRGEFTLECENKNYKIPVKVEIYDFSIDKEYNSKTCFMLNQDYLINGELDNTDEMYTTYFNALKEYRISAAFVPDANKSVEAFIASLQKYQEEYGLTSYAIPHCSNGAQIVKSELKKYLKAIIDISTEELDYLSMAYYYVYDLIDEFHTVSGGKARALQVCKDLEDTGNELFNELSDSGYFANRPEFKNMIEKSLKNIPNVVTSFLDEDLTSSKITWCPSYEYVDSSSARANYAAEQERVGSFWWYGCLSPAYPYPTYHIDDNLLGARVVSWMQYDYKIDGNLYWSTALFREAQLDGNIEAKPIDPYNEPIRLNASNVANGDGYLFYPGKKYGSPTPFPSLRIMAIRDGMEEYEYQHKLDSIYKKIALDNGLNFESSSVMRGVYDSMYRGTQYYNDFNAVEKAKSEVANLINLAQKYSFAISDININGTTAKVNFVLDKDKAVKVNGKNVDGEIKGKVKTYSLVLDLSKNDTKLDFEIIDGDKTINFTKFISSKVTMVADFDAVGDASLMKFTKDTVISLAENISLYGKSLKAEVANYYDANNQGESISFTPALYINKSKLGAEIKNLDTFSFSVYNDNDYDLEMSFKLSSISGDKNIDTYKLKSKTWTKVAINKINNLEWSNLSSADMIALTFNNLYDIKKQEALPPQILYFDNINYTLA